MKLRSLFILILLMTFLYGCQKTPPFPDGVGPSNIKFPTTAPDPNMMQPKEGPNEIKE